MSESPQPVEPAYVSAELTHFVGARLPEPEQYSLLVHILRSGWLSHPPHRECHEQRMRLYLRARLSANEAYFPSIVCFCDIPVASLRLHMSKYSSFGLSFHKAFLVAQGATPAFYVARNALVPKRRDGFEPRVERAPAGTRLPDEEFRIDDAEYGWIERSRAFDDEMARRREVYLERHELLRDAELPEHIRLHLAKTLRHETNLDALVFSLMKFFDAGLDTAHADNYYMEREWRVLSNVQFGLSDVARIILPESHADRFRRDVPDYHGPVEHVS